MSDEEVGQNGSSRPLPQPEDKQDQNATDNRPARDPIVQHIQCSHKCKASEDSLVVSQTSFIASICKVINVGIKQERISDWIKTVVNAAEELLDTKGLRAEDIHELLKVNTDGGSQGKY